MNAGPAPVALIGPPLVSVDSGDLPDNSLLGSGSPMHALVRSSLLLVAVAVTGFVHAQNSAPAAAAPAPAFTADYPADRAGVLMQEGSWAAIANAMPVRTRAAHGIAASLSYGIVPAKVVADYDGEHAATQVDAGQVTICICHMVAIPGDPAIVRLHPKKAARELDGGKMIVYPVVGGSKMADANKTDLIPVDVAHPDPQVWLVRPQFALPPGEYALMLGTQNISIFPFTVVPATAEIPGAK
jgi:hypothetical protein